MSISSPSFNWRVSCVCGLSSRSKWHPFSFPSCWSSWLAFGNSSTAFLRDVSSKFLTISCQKCQNGRTMTCIIWKMETVARWDFIRNLSLVVLAKTPTNMNPKKLPSCTAKAFDFPHNFPINLTSVLVLFIALFKFRHFLKKDLLTNLTK